MTKKKRSTIAQQTPSYAEIDWAKTTFLCSDVHCPCGEDFHHCTHGDIGSAQHARCPHCQKVIRLDARVNLFEEQVPDRELTPRAFMQWKGTIITMTAHCKCGTQFPIEGWFAYERNCPGCDTHYFTDWYVLVSALTDKEAEGVAPIHEYEDDLVTEAQA